jgi:SIR2-like domain
MTTHNPRREVEKLLELLASHDKPIAFLIGAGASCSVKNAAGAPLIPAIAKLGELCQSAVQALGDEYENAWSLMVADISASRECNIEEILSDVRRKIAALSSDEKLLGLDVGGLEKIEATIQSTIATISVPKETDTPQSLPHHALARWIRRTDRATPVEIFTTNYDTLIERGLEDERVAAFDGFIGSRQPFFAPQSLVHDNLAPGRKWVRLWKIHGSVNWAWVTLKDGTRRIVRGGENSEGQLILPSVHKYDESRKQPYAAMLERLRRVLIEREDTVLITVGYSFGDEHINEIIFDALDSRDRMHVFALCFGDIAADHVLMERARSRRNLVIYGRTRAVVGGVEGAWRLHEPVDESTAALLDIPFDSDAIAPGTDLEGVTGRMRLGDFQWLGRWLDTIAARND